MLELPDHADAGQVAHVMSISGRGYPLPSRKAGEAMAAKSRPGDGQHARGRKGGSRLGPEVHVGGLFKSVVLLVKGIVTR